ncbi:hypothetical protein BC829DRAFT_386658 [Chytridium lagenaria]|nr:hypothetical protein BC829DRAFT_386658 [Chytridium lagenaria]
MPRNRVVANSRATEQGSQAKCSEVVSSLTVYNLTGKSSNDLGLMVLSWLLRYAPQSWCMEDLHKIVLAGRLRAIKMIYAKLKPAHPQNAAYRNTNVMEYIYQKRMSSVPSDAMINSICIAAEAGDFDMVCLLFKLPDCCSGVIENAGVAIVSAARKGHRNIVQYLIPRLPNSLLDALDMAAGAEPAHTTALDLAVENGHLAVSKYLLHHTNARCSAKLLDTFLKAPALRKMVPSLVDRLEGSFISGKLKLEILQTILRMDMKIEWGNAIDVAAETGQDDMLDFFYQRFAAQPSKETVMDKWAGLGQLEGVKFLDKGMYCGWTTAALNNAYFMDVKKAKPEFDIVERAKKLGHTQVWNYLKTMPKVKRKSLK